MTLKNNRAPLLSNIKLYASFHRHMWILTGVTVWKRLSWVVTSVTLTFDLWPWPFAWTLLWSLVITPENFMMKQWGEHSQKDVTDGQTDRRTDSRTEITICRAAWSQLKIIKCVTYCWWNTTIKSKSNIMFLNFYKLNNQHGFGVYTAQLLLIKIAIILEWILLRHLFLPSRISLLFSWHFPFE